MHKRNVGVVPGRQKSDQSQSTAWIKKKTRTKRKIVLFIWSAVFAYIVFTPEVTQSASVAFDQNADSVTPVAASNKWSSLAPLAGSGKTRAVLGATDDNIANNGSTYAGNATGGQDDIRLLAGANCTPPSIDDFPPDLFTQAERQKGAVVIHFIASIYVFYTLAVVCDDYFVPSIECICDQLHLSSDVAGATFMAIATSSPELFTNLIGTFITEGDLGVGTIVGSAVFNILAVVACCGLAAKAALPLEWYPLTRDCIFYSISVILLIMVLINRQVFWYEALILVIGYILYIGVMFNNASLKRWAESLVQRNGKEERRRRRSSLVAALHGPLQTEKTPLLLDGHKSGKSSLAASFEGTRDGDMNDNNGDVTAEVLDELLIAKALHTSEAQAEEEKDEWGVLQLPHGQNCLIWIEWLVSWPARAALAITIPDCREARRRKLYPLTFTMCIMWIGSLSYVVSWMMTVIGHTFQISDSVMGLTFIAAGTSVPEAVSSIIVARQGLGTMSISNSIGSNTFDILICLGLPWLIRASMIAKEEVNFIQIHSGGLEYSAMLLMASLIMLYVTLACNRFVLDKKVGFMALVMYAIFLTFGSLLELNVFFPVNLPTCET